MTTDRALELAEAAFHAMRRGASPLEVVSKREIEDVLVGLGEARERLPELQGKLDTQRRNLGALGSEPPESQ
jgi:hypothetical protein